MSRSEWFDGPAGPGDGSARPEGPDEGHGGPPRAAGRRRRGPLGTTLLVVLGVVVVGGIARRRAHRRVVVRLGRLPRGLRQGAHDQARHLRRRPALITGGVVASSLVIAYRTRPLYIPVTPAQQVLEQYRQAIEPLRRIAVWAVPVVLGLLAGVGLDGRVAHLPAVGQPRAVRHQGPAVRPRRRLLRLHPAVAALRRQLRDRRARRWRSSPRPSPTTSTAACSCPAAGRPPARPTCTSASSARSSRSPGPRRTGSTATRCRPRRASLLTGITYTDDNAVLPDQGDPRGRRADVRRLLPRRDLEPQLAAADHRRRAARRHRRRGGRHLPGPDPVAQGQPVGRSRSRRSTSSATSTPPGRRSGSTGSSASRTRRAAETENKAVLRAAANDIPGVRIIDPNVVAPTFRQLEGQRDYYAFPDTLDVDRYTIDDQTRDAVVAVREINLDGPARRPAQLAQRPHRLHPRLRLLRGVRQPAHDRGRPGLLRGWRPQRDRRVRAARCTSASCRRPTPWSAPSERRRRASSTSPRAVTATSPCRTPTPVTAACRSARPCAGWPTRSSTARPTSCSRMP